jgi:hypothetical protein
MFDCLEVKEVTERILPATFLSQTRERQGKDFFTTARDTFGDDSSQD